MRDIEKEVLANLISSKENCKLFFEKDASSAYFMFPEPRKFFDILEYHYTHHHDVLQQDSFETYLRLSSKMSDEYKAKLSVMYEEIKMQPIASNFGVLLEEFTVYYKTNTLAKGMSDITSFLADKEPDKAIDLLSRNLHKLKLSTTKNQFDSGYFGSEKEDLIQLYDKRRDHPELFRGIELGFPSMDEIITHKPGTVLLIVGQMKSAKSVLMVNIAANILANGKKVYYHCNEGGRELVVSRLVSCENGLSMSKIEKTQLDPTEYTLFQQGVRKYKNTSLLYVDSVPPSSSTADHIYETLQELQERDGKYHVALVDYLGLMSTNKPVESDWKKYGVITEELKDVSMKLHIPIIVIAHVNRKGMEEKKNHFDLSEMGLSLEPLKTVDVIASWRIHDPDIFDITNTGQGTLSIRGSRQSGQKSVVLEVNTNKMKIWENHKNISIFSPGVDFTVTSFGI